MKAEVKYYICEGISFPCFVRPIFYFKNNYIIQILEEKLNNRLSCLSIDIDAALSQNKYLIAKNELLDLKQANYGIALNENEIACGSKEYIATQIEPKINELDLYFKVDYYKFIGNNVGLMFAYQELSEYDGASNKTKLWASKEYKKIQGIVFNALRRTAIKQPEYKMILNFKNYPERKYYEIYTSMASLNSELIVACRQSSFNYYKYQLNKRKSKNYAYRFNKYISKALTNREMLTLINMIGKVIYNIDTVTNNDENETYNTGTALKIIAKKK